MLDEQYIEIAERRERQKVARDKLHSTPIARLIKRAREDEEMLPRKLSIGNRSQIQALQYAQLKAKAKRAESHSAWRRQFKCSPRVKIHNGALYLI